MSQIEKGIKATTRMYREIAEIDQLSVFLSTMATVFDRWCAEHDVSVEKADAYAVYLVQGMLQSHKLIGLPEKYEKEE